jgi:hypothetical protein
MNPLSPLHPINKYYYNTEARFITKAKTVHVTVPVFITTRNYGVQSANIENK